jgi:hypothetical protein
MLILTLVGYIPYLGGLVRLGAVCLGLGVFAGQSVSQWTSTISPKEVGHTRSTAESPNSHTTDNCGRCSQWLTSSSTPGKEIGAASTFAGSVWREWEATNCYSHAQSADPVRDDRHTRSRVSLFMNRFRELGFIDYGDRGPQVHCSLLNVVLRD